MDTSGHQSPTHNVGRAVALELDHAGVAVFVYATGSLWNANDLPDYGTMKMDPDTGQLSDTWPSVADGDGVRRYNFFGSVGTSGQDRAFAIAVIGRGSVYVAGTSQRGETFPTDFDYATIRYNEDGDEVWVERYHLSGDDAAHAVAMTIAGASRVTGESDDTGKDYLTVLYEDGDAIEELPSAVTTYAGTHATGNLASLEDDDGDRYEVIEQVPFVPTNPGVGVEISLECSINNPSELTVIVDANSNANPFVPQVIFIRDYQSSTWVELDRRNSTSSDRTLYLTPPGDPSRYLDSQNVARVRVTYWETYLTVFTGWRGRIDMVRLRVLE